MPAHGGNTATGPFAFPGLAGSGLGGVIWSSNATMNCYNSIFTSNLVVGADDHCLVVQAEPDQEKAEPFLPTMGR